MYIYFFMKTNILFRLVILNYSNKHIFFDILAHYRVIVNDIIIIYTVEIFHFLLF